MPNYWLSYLVLAALFITLAVLIGIAGRRIWALLNKPPVDDPERAKGWQFENHPRDAVRSLWWIVAGLGLVAGSGLLLVLIVMTGVPVSGQGVIAVTLGPVMGGVMCLAGAAMLLITSIRFRMYRWLSVMALVGVAIAGGWWWYHR